MTDQACTTYSVDKEGGLFVFQATQRITYSTKKPVPIKEVIIALQGLEGVLKPVPLVLRELTGIEIERSEFLIQSLQAGSLIEDVVVKFFFGDKDRLDDFVKRLGGKAGYEGCCAERHCGRCGRLRFALGKRAKGRSND